MTVAGTYCHPKLSEKSTNHYRDKSYTAWLSTANKIESSI